MKKDLDVLGYKEVTIQGKKFLIRWDKSSGIYEGTTSYSYEEEGETKTKHFVSKNDDKETAWESLIDDIENFVGGGGRQFLISVNSSKLGQRPHLLVQSYRGFQLHGCY